MVQSSQDRASAKYPSSQVSPQASTHARGFSVLHTHSSKHDPHPAQLEPTAHSGVVPGAPATAHTHSPYSLLGRHVRNP
jgi:hypothetical protein